jgi:uncharacterized membrane protein
MEHVPFNSINSYTVVINFSKNHDRFGRKAISLSEKFSHSVTMVIARHWQASVIRVINLKALGYALNMIFF